MSDLTTAQVLNMPHEEVQCDQYLFDEFYEYTNFIYRIVKLQNGDFYTLVDVPITTQEQKEAEEAYGPFTSLERAASGFYRMMI